MYPNGTTDVVEQVGGMLAYYLLYGEDIQAFPAGFRLLAGDKNQRNFTWPVPDPPKATWSGAETSQFALMQKAIGFNCLDYSKTPEASLYRHFMPDKEYLDANCIDGIRLEMMFPSCWNGKDLDPPDHKSHMAYPSTVIDGTCPEGFDKRVPSLFYETIWNTYAYAGVEGQFLLANGDPTGCGYHGDFIAGWDPDFLQSAVDTCTNESGQISDCPLFDIQSDADAATCTFKMPSELDDDNCAGPRDGLCGNVPIQSGPAYATAYGSGSTVAPTKTKAHSTQTPDSYSTTDAATAVVPTLSYSSGTKKVTDKHGGGITVAKIATSVSVDDSATTAAPVVSYAADSADGSIVSSTLYTSEGKAYEIFYEEVIETVYASTTTTTTVYPKHKRHHVKHHRHIGDF
jgi:hypothetical protein